MKSLENALAILAEFTNDEPSLGVTELSRRSGMTKGQVSKILATFRKNGFVEQDARTKLYSVGAGAFALGSRYVNFHPIARESASILRRLVDETGHSARLSWMTGDRILYLLQIEGKLLSDTGWRVGTFLPFHATSVGKVTLAFIEPERSKAIMDRLEMTPLTERTLTRKADLVAEIDRIRLAGYGTARGESTVGLAAVAVPIFGSRNTLLSAISLSYPQHLVDEQEERRLAEALHDAARVLSQRMGASVYPFGGSSPGAPGTTGRRRKSSSPA